MLLISPLYFIPSSITGSQRPCFLLLPSSFDPGVDKMDGGGDDWDLAAVVRSCRCCSRPNPPPAVPVDAAPAASSVPVFRAEERGEELLSRFFPDLFATTTSTGFEGLQDLYTPFQFNKQQPLTSAAAAAAAAADPTVVCVPRKAQRPVPRPNKRRKELKRVVRQVPADGAAADIWAWRKYGQKPIKGSPYPRGYYRCSSFRGCPARKQVERHRTDPGLLVITYTSEHNHPVPARHVFASEGGAADGGGKEVAGQLASSPTTSASTDGDEDDKEEGEEGAVLTVEDMEVIGEDELVFVGDADAPGATSSLFQDDDGGDGGGGAFEDRLLFATPWLDGDANGGATAAAC